MINEKWRVILHRQYSHRTLQQRMTTINKYTTQINHRDMDRRESNYKLDNKLVLIFKKGATNYSVTIRQKYRYYAQDTKYQLQLLINLKVYQSYTGRSLFTRVHLNAMWHTPSLVVHLALEASTKWHHCYAVSDAINWVTHLVSSFTTLAFLTNVNEKRKYTTPSAIQVKNQWQKIGTEEKLDVIKLPWKRWTNCWHMV
jgi:hypothetical protein